MFKEEKKRKPITREFLINKALPPISASASNAEALPPSPASTQSSTKWLRKGSMDNFKYYAHSRKERFIKKSYLPPLIIPSNDDLTSRPKDLPRIETTILLNTQLSPKILSCLKPRQVSASSSPPSLDESLSSERAGNMSDPPTPVMGSNESDDNSWSGGVQLQPAAMATLRLLSGGDDTDRGSAEQLVDVNQSKSKKPEMLQQRPPHIITNYFKKRITHESPKLPKPPESLMSIEIPSPGSFFSALSPGAKETWHHVQASSTTTECFKTSNSPTMKISNQDAKNISESSTQSLGLRGSKNLSERSSEHLYHSETIEINPKIVKSNSTASKKSYDKPNINLDRTSFWVADQSLLLANSINLTDDTDSQIASIEEQLLKASVLKASEPFRAKSIHKHETVINDLSPKIEHSDTAFFQAFRNSIAQSNPTDAFFHQASRIKALQSQLACSPSLYQARMLGIYQFHLPCRNSRNILSFSVAAESPTTYDEQERSQNGEEYEVLKQISPQIWNLMAVKFLNGGRLFIAPLDRRLTRSSSVRSSNSRLLPNQMHILDLGGQPIFDWAWHCATECPNTQVYSVVTKALHQETFPKINGPKNHHNVTVDRLTKLPFDDNQFDLISTRDFYTILKSQAEDGTDEWNDCLNECMRILKPGGILEFCIIDSDIATTGPLGTAKSEEFGFNLNLHGYDPYPSQQWLRRLDNAGFSCVNRTWLFLPLGGNQKVQKSNPKSKTESKTKTIGSTQNIASVSGLIGAWAWQKWLSRFYAQNEGAEGALDGVYDIIEEGRRGSAGWRCITGWAKKT